MSDEIDFAKYWKSATSFAKKKPEKSNMLREVNYDGMWQHSCMIDLPVMWIGKGETCNYCGAWEEDGDNPPASPNAE